MEDAERAFRRAVTISETLTNDFPKREYFGYQYVDSCGRLIMLLRSSGRTEEAEHILRGMKDPVTAGAYSRRASLFGQLRDWDRALADFAKAIELEPRNADVWTRRANFYVDQGQWEKALADFEKALEVQPANAGDCNNLAWYDKAVEWTEKNKPDDEELLRFRAEAAELLEIAEKTPVIEEKAEKAQ